MRAILTAALICASMPAFAQMQGWWNAVAANQTPVVATGGTTLLTSQTVYYKLDENVASGTRADASANGMDLTDTSANISSTASGIIGRAADASGVNGQLNHADNAIFQVGGNQDFTIQVWVNRQSSSATFSPFLCKGAYDPNTTEYYLAFEGAAKPQFAVSNGSTGATAVWGTTLADNSWHHVIAWYDHNAQTINLVVDNGTVVTTSWTGGTRTTSGAVFSLFSSSTPASYYTKQIDEVCMWKRVLTSGEITSLYNSGAGLDYSLFGSTP